MIFETSESCKQVWKDKKSDLPYYLSWAWKRGEFDSSAISPDTNCTIEVGGTTKRSARVEEMKRGLYTTNNLGVMLSFKGQKSVICFLRDYGPVVFNKLFAKSINLKDYLKIGIPMEYRNMVLEAWIVDSTVEDLNSIFGEYRTVLVPFLASLKKLEVEIPVSPTASISPTNSLSPNDIISRINIADVVSLFPELNRKQAREFAFDILGCNTDIDYNQLYTDWDFDNSETIDTLKGYKKKFLSLANVL